MQDIQCTIKGKNVKNAFRFQRILTNIFFLLVRRKFDSAILLIDRAEISLTQHIQRNITQPMMESSNKVFIGGINSTDSRYTIYKSYSGCLSSKI